ncbi:MAG: LysR family transcriptional regulator [Lachnospiraceae bacterium]|nr:LysR family transcriptional regulator [Lachnospiraceae bacterium]
MISIINFEYFKVFYYVAKAKNITRAAEEMYISQPAVTKTLQSLESQLGCELIVRSNKGIDLTPDGLRFFNMIAPSCEELISVERCISQGCLHAGTISISVNPPMLDRLTKILLAYRKKYPQIDVRVDTDIPEMKRQYLRDKSRDIIVDLEGIIDRDQKILDGWTTTTIFGVPLRAYAGEGLAQLFPEPVNLIELLSYPLLLPSENGFLDILCQNLDREQVEKIKPMQMSGSLSVQRVLAAMNEGILFSFDINEPDDLTAYGLTRLDVIDPLPVHSVVMYAQEECRMSTPALAFKNLLLKHMLGISAPQ